jgi:hypothetical protein
MADNSGLIVSALEKTAPELAASIDSRNSWKAAIKERAARINLYRKYERGDHRQNMTTQMKKMLRLIEDDSGLSELNVNYCKVIIDKMAGRIAVSSIGIDTVAEQWLKEILLLNDFDAAQSEWFRGAIRDGDSYVMVDPVTGMWSSEPAYDGFSGVEVIFDKMGHKPVWACKLWSEADIQDIKDISDNTNNASIKLVVYQPGRISYWVGNENGQEVSVDNIVPVNPRVNPRNASLEFTELNNEQKWPVSSGHLPFVRFTDQKDNYTSYGESELRPAIPLQDSLNAIQHDKIMASKLTAFRIYWSIGIPMGVDGILPGAVINLTLPDIGNAITEEQIAFLNACKVGQFDGADITQYTNQIEKEVMQISQVTQTPIYGVTAEGNLSGEALKQLEVGFIGKIERFQRQNTDALKELISLTAEIQNSFEGENAPPFQSINVIWKSPELLDANARIAALMSMKVQFSNLWSDSWYRDRIGSLLGMSKDDIAQEEALAKTRQEEQLTEKDMFADQGV